MTRDRSQAAEAYRAESQLLLTALGAVGGSGVTLESILNDRRSVLSALSSLVAWLQRPGGNQRLRERLIRALAFPGAVDAADTLALVLRDPANSPATRWTAGNALECMASGRISELLIDLAQQKELGSNRQMVVLSLAKLEPSNVESILLGCVDDKDVGDHAVAALTKLPISPSIQRQLETELQSEYRPAWVKSRIRRKLAHV